MQAKFYKQILALGMLHIRYSIGSDAFLTANVDLMNSLNHIIWYSVSSLYSIPYMIHRLNEFAAPISYDTVCMFGGSYHMVHFNITMC